MTDLETFVAMRPEVPPPSREELLEARRVLQGAIEREERRQMTRAPGPRWQLWGAAAATVAVLLLVFVNIVGPTTGPLAPESAAAAALNDAAEATGLTLSTMPPGPILEPGEFVHSTSEGAYLQVVAIDGSLFSALVPYRREVWKGADGSGRLIQTVGEPQFLAPQDRALWLAAGSPVIAESVDRQLGPGGFAIDEVGALPTEPEMLRQVLTDQLAESGEPSPAALFDRVAELLSESELTPELRVALYRVAATVEGIELFDDIADRLGRRSTAVGLTYTHAGVKQRSVLVFDPATGELLGMESTVLSESPEIHAPYPVNVGYVVYTGTEVVDHLPGA